MKTSNGFTWRELAIVITFIVVLAAVVIPNVVGLLDRNRYYVADGGVYFQKSCDNCIEGNWTFDNVKYHWFQLTPIPTYTYHYFCTSCSGNFYPCRYQECTGDLMFVYVGDNEIAGYCSSCSGNTTSIPCNKSLK